MIQITGVNKSFGAQDILRDINLRIGAGEHVAIVGPNGCGKSTLFSIIIGEQSCDSGTVSLPRGLRLGHVRQQLNVHAHDETLIEYAESGMPELAAIQHELDQLESQLAEPGVSGDEQKQQLRRLGELQTTFENMDGYTIRSRAEAALSGFGFTPADFARPFREFSGGWQMRAELVRVLIANPEILMMDEPSNYLDIPAIEWLQRFLRDFPGALLLISHDRYLLNSLTSVTIELSHGRATRYAGNFDFYTRERVARCEQQEASYRNQQKKREKAERFIDRFRATSTKASQVQSKIKMLDRIEEVELPQHLKNKRKIRLAAPDRSGQEVARLEAMGFTYDAQRWVLRNVDLRIERGDKIALVGLNGLGKTTLLRVLAGQLQPSEGKRVVGHKVTVGYQSQDFAETMNDRLTVYETVRSLSRHPSDRDVRTLLGGFGFTGDDTEKSVKVLSGGEKVRLAFARLLIDPPNFLLLDEPTTHLDISAREAIEEALIAFTGTLCIVSHDIEFVRRVAGVIIAMTPPGITRFCGGYDYYLEKKEPSSPSARKEKPMTGRRAERQASARVVQKYSAVRRDIQKQIQHIEKRIEACEMEQAELLEQLKGTNVDYATVNKNLTTVQQTMTDYNLRWEAFAIELDELESEYKTARQQT